MKRLIITLLLISTTFGVRAFDFAIPQQGGYSLYFNITKDGSNSVEVTSPTDIARKYWQEFNMPSGMVVIPEQVLHNGRVYNVTAIGNHAFSGCRNITSLILPKSLTEIGAYAFYQCDGIKGTLTIDEGIVSIGSSAFYGCSGIIKVQFNAISCEAMGGSKSKTVFGDCRNLLTVAFGNQVKRIPDFAFSGMTHLQLDSELPRDLEYIGEYAFAYCINLTQTLTIPSGVTIIGPYAFAHCNSIKTLTIPKDIKSIRQYAFYNCSQLAQITILAFYPPDLADGVFTNVSSSATYSIPCIGLQRYQKSEEWHKLNLHSTNPCTYNLVARPTIAEGAIVTGGGFHRVGDRIQLTVLCAAGYSFQGWTDGVKDNPRNVTIDDTVSYIAIVKPAEITKEISYIHDTVFSDGIKVVHEYYEINDVAQPIGLQEQVIYNNDKRRLDINIDKNNLLKVDLYNSAGECVISGLPRHGNINMRRFPTGYYIVRVTTIEDVKILKFLHVKKK